MENIKIKCILCDTLCLCEYYIKVFDLKNNLIIKKHVIGDLNLRLKYGTYKVKIRLKDGTFICKPIVVRRNLCKTYIFKFNEYNPNLRPIILTLTDRFYPGLKIEKGEITIWNKT